MQGSDGNFYGTTFGGGANGNCAGGCGTVFKITPIGALTTLYSFCSQPNCADGDEPLTTLVQGTDGNFYGETQLGGAYCPPNGCGTVFKITSSGTLTTLHSFNGADGCCIPDNPLLQATDGNFYGTSASGGANGTVFEMTPSGTLTTLYSFEGADGENPYAGLVQAVDGSFYGTTSNGGSGGGGTVFRFALPVQLVPVTPCRVVDTRGPTGIFGGPPIQGGAYRSFPIPQSACNISANAAAYSLNVTVVPHGALGYLTIWPTGDSQPYVSTMNSPDGRIKANAAVLPKGANGAVSVYATDTTDVILDIDGYFAPPASNTYQFYPLTPCRIVDTRGGDGGMLQPGVERDYLIAGNCEVPSDAAAYSFNVTVLPAAGGLDYLTVWPQGESQPVVSTLNDNTGTVVANAAIVPAGSNNTTAFYAHSNSTNLLVDVNGYFAAPGTGGYSFYAVPPCRVLDTRGSGGSFMGEKTVNVIGSACAPPSNAAAYIFNATVVPPGSMPLPHACGRMAKTSPWYRP